MADKTKQIFGEKNRFKVGLFTRDTALASGTQVVSGVGFEPRACYFFACQSGVVGEMSLGLDDGANKSCIYDRHTCAVDTWATTNVRSILCMQTCAAYYTGNIQSFGSDGFTIAWARNGVPTGTITIIYLAMR